MAQSRVLHIANRPDFIADDTVQKFEAETGIAVTYEVVATDAKMLAGLRGQSTTHWDLVIVPELPVFAAGVRDSLFRPIDVRRLSNYDNLDSEIGAPTSDPAHRFGIPYLWGTAGLAINAARLSTANPRAVSDSLALLFDPAMAARDAQCGLAIEDDPLDAVPALLSYLRLDPATTSAADLKRAEDALMRVKPLLRRLPPEDFAEALSNGTLCVGFGASTDVADARSRANDRENGIELGYVVPREGSRRWIAMAALPRSAQHVDEAMAFIDFLLRPEVIADISEWTGAANPNRLAAGFVDDDRGGETLFPSEASRQRLYPDLDLPPDALAARARLWARTRP